MFLSIPTNVFSLASFLIQSSLNVGIQAIENNHQHDHLIYGADFWQSFATEDLQPSFLPEPDINFPPVTLTERLKYSLFDGISSLRSIEPIRVLPTNPPTGKSSRVLLAIALLLLPHHHLNPNDSTTSSTALIESAHEVLLGVDWSNLEEAEYAGTHRGQTDWQQRHPLSAENDVLHSMLHRIEGPFRGEGGYTGYDNAKYWIAGGPKQLPTVGKEHHVHQELRRIVSSLPTATAERDEDGTMRDRLCEFIADQDRVYEIIADGGKFRNVLVPKDCWDPIAVIDACRKREHSDAITKIQQLELRLLAQIELKQLQNEEGLSKL